MKTATGILVFSIVLGLAANAGAVLVPFVVPMDGAQEAPGPGDPDGTGTALLTIDSDALTIDWHITVDDIDLPLTGAHIHEAPAGMPGPIVVDFSAQLTGAGLYDPDLADVLADPSGFYVNVHNEPFPDGAVRGQIPEPATLGLMGLGLVGLRVFRRRRLA